jgi:PiT family inorganic phosphate transporter
MLWLLVIFALVFAFINGLRDGSSIMAGVMSSRSLSPRLARTLCGVAELVAPFIFGREVAKTLTTGLVDPKVVSLGTITAAIAAALLWTVIAWLRGIPSSSSHALVGGILGATLTVGGPQSLIYSGLYKVLLPLFLAPVIGLGVGYIVMKLILYLARNATPRVNLLFKGLQVITMVSLALSHSANDAQKSMGMITLGLLLARKIPTFDVPFYVVALCATAIALGTWYVDWRLIRTLGRKIFRIRPINALASQAASTSVILLSAVFGAPVSTSQVISMALLGTGAAERINKVRWQIGGEMLVTWFLTVPITMLIATIIVKGAAALNF